jgi:hypothetical protein
VFIPSQTAWAERPRGESIRIKDEEDVDKTRTKMFSLVALVFIISTV